MKKVSLIKAKSLCPYQKLALRASISACPTASVPLPRPSEGPMPTFGVPDRGSSLVPAGRLCPGWVLPDLKTKICHLFFNGFFNLS